MSPDAPGTDLRVAPLHLGTARVVPIVGVSAPGDEQVRRHAPVETRVRARVVSDLVRASLRDFLGSTPVASARTPRVGAMAAFLADQQRGRGAFRHCLHARATVRFGRRHVVTGALSGPTMLGKGRGPAWGPLCVCWWVLAAVVVVVLVGGLEVALERPVGDVGAEGFAGEDGVSEVQAGPDARVDELVLRSLTVAKVCEVVRVLAPPCAPGMVALMLSVPSAVEMTWASALVMQPCWAGYSGWLGVVSSGLHVGSAVIAGLPARSALRIAVMGRQER